MSDHKFENDNLQASTKRVGGSIVLQGSEKGGKKEQIPIKKLDSFVAVPEDDYSSPPDNGSGVVLKAENSLKDEDLMSGRLNYLLDPVMFPQSTEGVGEKSVDYPTNGVRGRHTKINKQVSENAISPEDSVGGPAMNLTRKMETTSTRRHAGRESTMGLESGTHNREGSPYQSRQRLSRPGKKQPKDFNKMSHYEIMEHIEGAALRQRLNQSKQQRGQQILNVPKSEVNLAIGRKNAKGPTQSPPMANYSSYDFMQQAEMAAEAFAKQQMSGLTLNAADHIDSSQGGNTMNTQDRMERRLKGSQAQLRDEVGSPISLPGVPRQASNMGRSSKKNYSYQQQQFFQSKKSYKQIGFAPNTDGPGRFKDYGGYHQGYVPNKKTTRDVPGTDTLIMSQTSQNLNRLRFARASQAVTSNNRFFGSRRSTGSHFGVSGRTVKRDGQLINSPEDFYHGQNHETALSTKYDEAPTGGKWLSNSNTSLNKNDQSSSKGLIQNRNAFRYRGRLVHSQEQKYRMNRQGFARSSVEDIRIGSNQTNKPDYRPDQKVPISALKTNITESQADQIGADLLSSPVENANTLSRQPSKLRRRNFQTAGLTTTSVPKSRPPKVASPGFFANSSDVLQPPTRAVGRRTSNNEDLTIPHTREIPPSSTHRSSLEIGKGTQQLPLNQKVLNHQIKIEKLRTVIKRNNGGQGQGLQAPEAYHTMRSGDQRRHQRIKSPSATIIGVTEVERTGQVDSPLSKSLENYEKIQMSDDDSKEFGTSKKHLFSPIAMLKDQQRVVINRSKKPKQPHVPVQQKEYVPIQDLHLNEAQGEKQQVTKQQILIGQHSTKSPTSYMQDSSNAFSPLSRTNMFLTQRQRRFDVNVHSSKAFITRYRKRVKSRSNSPPQQQNAKKTQLERVYRSQDGHKKKSGDIMLQHRRESAAAANARHFDHGTAVQILKLPPKTSAYINALKQNEMRNEEMVKRYQDKTLANKEVAIQARERNSSSLTQSQVAQRSSNASVAAVVVQFNNDLPKAEGASPDKLGIMQHRLKNESQQQNAQQPPTAGNLLAMRRDSAKQSMSGSGRPLDHDIGTQYDQQQEHQDQPSQTSDVTVIREARGRSPAASLFSKDIKKHSQLKPTQCGRSAARHYIIQSQQDVYVQDQDFNNSASNAQTPAKAAETPQTQQASILLFKQRHQSAEQPIELSIQRIELNYNNQDKSTRGRLQRQRVSGKVLKPADDAQKSKSRLSCNTKYAEKENAEEAHHEDGSEVIMTPPLATSHMNLINRSEPESALLKRVVSKDSKSSSSKSIIAISGKHTRIPGNVQAQDNQPANITDMSTPKDGKSDYTPKKSLGNMLITEAQHQLDKSKPMSQSSSIIYIPARESTKSAHRLFRERERQDFLIRQQELLDKKAAPDAKARQSNRATRHLMEGQLQQLGHVSELSRRQHALLNQTTVSEREIYLKEPVNLQDTFKKIIRSRDALSLRQDEQPEPADAKKPAEKQPSHSRSRKSKKKQYSLPNYQYMPLSTSMIGKLQLDLELKKSGMTANLFRGTQAKVEFAEALEQREAQKPKFDKEIIQSKEDELVFQRINPHLEAQKTEVNIPDQSLLALLQKNGGVPLTDEQCREMLSPKDKKKKPYHMLNEFEKETRNMITSLRLQSKADSLQGTLLQYMKENREKKEQQKLTEYCQYLLQLQAAKKRKEIEEQQRLARSRLRFPQANQGQELQPDILSQTTAQDQKERTKLKQNASQKVLNTGPPNSAGRPLSQSQTRVQSPCSNAKQSHDIIKSSSATQQLLFSGRAPQSLSLDKYDFDMVGKDTSTQLKLGAHKQKRDMTKSLVDDYLAEQERELARLKQIEEEERLFQQQIRARGMLNLSRETREEILRKLACIPQLEQQQKQFAAQFKKESELRRRQHIQQSNMSEFYKHRQIEKLKAIHSQIETRKEGKQSQDSPDAQRDQGALMKEKVKFVITNADISDPNDSDKSGEELQIEAQESVQLLDHELGKDLAVTDKQFFRQYLTGLDEKYPKTRYDKISEEDAKMKARDLDASSQSRPSRTPRISDSQRRQAEESMHSSAAKQGQPSRESGADSFSPRPQSLHSQKLGAEDHPEAPEEPDEQEKQQDEIKTKELALLRPPVDHNTSPSHQESVLEANRRKSGSKKLDESAKANQNLLENIRRQRTSQSLCRQGQRVSGAIGKGKNVSAQQRPKTRQQGGSATDSKQRVPDRNRLFQLARACHVELSDKPVKDVLSGSFASQLKEAHVSQNEIMSKLERLKENMQRVRPHEPSDTYEDIQMDNIKDELDLARKEEAAAARVARAELMEAKHPRQFLRDQYIRCMQEFGY